MIQISKGTHHLESWVSLKRSWTHYQPSLRAKPFFFWVFFSVFFKTHCRNQRVLLCCCCCCCCCCCFRCFALHQCVVRKKSVCSTATSTQIAKILLSIQPHLLAFQMCVAFYQFKKHVVIINITA